MDFMTHLGVAELVSHALCFGYDTIGRAPVSVNPSRMLPSRACVRFAESL